MDMTPNDLEFVRNRLRAPYERKAVWDRWGDNVNAHLTAIDDWFWKYESRLKFALEEPERSLLKAHIRDLSGVISQCPGKPGNEMFAPIVPDDIKAKVPVGVYAVGDEAVRRIDEGLAERAKQRRRAARAEVFLFFSIAAGGAILLGLWWFGFLRG